VANVLSVGDLVLFAGLALLLARACRPLPAPAPPLAHGDAVL
jgi:hypothetical protein